MVLLLATIGLLSYTIAVFCWIVAMRNCYADDWGGFWALTPIWKMKDRFNPKGYRYFWIAVILTILGSIMALSIRIF